MAIDSNPISNSLADPNSITSRWGITASEYTIDGKQVDLQDLMVDVSKNRAVAVEGEVEPLSTRIRERNARLEALGEALAEMTQFQAAFDDDDSGEDDGHGWFGQETADVLRSLGYVPVAGSATGDRDERPDFYYNVGNPTQYSAKKKVVEGMIQRLKSEIDGLNNASQLDMSRLQQLVDRRDESYSTATNLMTAISDTRANLIRNL